MNNQNKREYFTFYRSFHDALKEMPNEVAGKIYKSIFEYAFCFKKPELESFTSLEKTIWYLIEPNITKSISQYTNGIKAKNKPSESQLEANSKPSTSEDKDKDKDKDKELRLKNKDKEEDKEEDKEKKKIPKQKFGILSNVLLTIEQNEKLKQELGTRYEPMLKEFSEGIAIKDYGYKDHYLAILKWSRNNFKKPNNSGKTKEEIIDTANFFLEGLNND